MIGALLVVAAVAFVAGMAAGVLMVARGAKLAREAAEKGDPYYDHDAARESLRQWAALYGLPEEGDRGFNRWWGAEYGDE